MRLSYTPDEHAEAVSAVMEVSEYWQGRYNVYRDMYNAKLGECIELRDEVERLRRAVDGEGD